MVVTISAWIYIVCSVLSFGGLLQLRSNGERAYAVFCALVLLAIGIGLLMRRNWARWLTLGMSFLTWTLGSLGLLWGLGSLIKLFFQPRGVSLPDLVVTLLVFALAVAYIRLNFGLFERLNSPEGREEFKTPDAERHAVMKSSGLYIAVSLIGAFAVAPGSHGTATPPAETVRVESTAEARAPDLAGQPGHLDDEATRALAARLEEARQAQEEREATRFQRLTRAPASTRARDDAQPADTAQDERSTAILKCRDASGAVSFTQGHCPAGTTRVESSSRD